MPLEKSGIDLPPYPYGLYGAKPKDVQGRTKTKADCKSGKYINIHIRRCQLDYFVLKFIYSEKATKFCKISTLLLTGTT